jgi:hypothetical protein
MPLRISLLVAWLVLLGMVQTTVAQPPKGNPKQPRVDQYGDPLPSGAVARLGTGRLCQARVVFMAFSHDDQALATVNQYGVLQVWEVDTGKETLRRQL